MSNISMFFKQLGFMMICAAVTNCADDSEIVSSTSGARPVVQASEVINYTVTGSYTEFKESVDCSTCTFTVPEDVTIIDGEKEKIGPGSVVCLQKGLVKKAVEFVNIEGSEGSPVVIGVCGK